MKQLRPLLIVAGIMLGLAIFNGWPYSYYQLMRIVVCIAAAYGAYEAFTLDRSSWGWVLGAIAILFNPLAPIHLNKAAWMLPDLIASIIMFTAAYKMQTHKSTEYGNRNTKNIV